jgi:hypothetical protein
MNDQNQPKLSLEEELDVLEAVYKIGKEKGLELLRPEQVKKLRDGGRMGNSDAVSVKNLNTTFASVIIDSVVSDLLSRCEDFVWIEVGSKDSKISDSDLRGLAWDRFVFEYGTDPTSLKELLYKQIYY